MSQNYPPQPPPGWTPQPPPQQPQPKPKKKHTFLKIVGASLAAIIAIGVAASLVDGGDPTTTAGSTPSAPASQGSAPEPTPEAESAPPVEEAAEEPAPTPEEPTPKPEPIKYDGKGDKILMIAKPEDGPGYAIITHKGDENFVVETVGTEHLLVNVIGNYTGRVPFDLYDGEDTKRLKITADGSWTVTTIPFASLRIFQADAISGEGDDVLVYVGEDGAVATIKHDGEENFVVQTFGGSDELLVNEIGSYSGEQLLPGESLIQISADGDWSIKITG